MNLKTSITRNTVHSHTARCECKLMHTNIKCVEEKRVVWNTATSGSASLGFQGLTRSLMLKGSWGFLLSFPLVIH